MGGACVNDLLLQFQADLLRLPVARRAGVTLGAVARTRGRKKAEWEHALRPTTAP
ncbi:MAG: hypothetical protein EST26_06915 [Hydrogenophaga sp.]|nr:hypothetical protein [Hydrogenophaga sp.]